jgi:RNA-directed DNA polymerase
MHVLEKSDCVVVPVNQPNKGGQPSAEVGEGRAQTKENIVQSHMHPTQSGKRRSQGLDGVREVAKERKQERFTALLHHLNVDLLRDSFYALQRKASPGVDGVTWQEYETGLEDRLVDLHSRVHRGAYRAKPSRRVFIPKADGRQRPLGIAALEDKIVQQAVVTILNQIYEVDFKGFSYGFRPGRSPHQALDALTVGIQRKRVNWVLDADIRGFFDNLSHEWMMKFIEHRVADRRILRLIQKWLKAGVSEDGQWSETKLGTPPGAVVSPLIANVYLHYLFDLWADVWRKKVAKGDVIVVRYADDLVVGFQHRTEAERFLKQFRERLAKFGSSSGGSPLATGKSGERENQRPSPFWALPTTVGNATRAAPSPYGGSLRKSEWLRNSKPSRLSFNAECMIAWPKSVHGSGRLCWVITNTTQSPGTRLSYAFLSFACVGSGRVFWSAAASAPRCGGNVSPQS